MNPAIAAALIALASYRIWRLLAVDTFAPVRLPRERLEAIVADTKAGWVYELVSCPWCAGTWITAAVTWATWAWTGGFAAPVLVGAGAATVVGLVAQHDEGNL